MTDSTTTFDYRVSPYRFTDRPEEVRRFLEDIGLRPTISKDGYAVLRGTAGMVAVHPVASAVTTDRVTTSFCLETDDARAAADTLAQEGLTTRWWDESFGRRAMVRAPEAEISLNEPMTDTYGYIDHRPDDLQSGFAVEVVSVLFTAQPDRWEAFFRRLGFAAVTSVPGWRELRSSAASGVVGLHASEPDSPAPDDSGLSFKTSEPISDFVDRMRGLGYEVTEEPEAQAPHVTVTDPDGERLEIHQL